MNKLTTERLKAIIADAPKGATHWDGSYYYIVNESANKSSEIWNVISPYKWHESGNLRLNDLIDMRSLDDIAEIVELREEVARLENLANNLVESRQGDINTADGSVAAVGIDELIFLESYLEGNG